MSEMVNVFTSFQRYNLAEKIENGSLEQTDFIHIQGILSLHLIYLKQFYRQWTEPNETWEPKKILIATHVIRLHHLFNLLTYLSITLFNPSQCIRFPKTDYIDKLNFSNPCRKEILIMYICKGIDLVNKSEKNDPDFEFNREFICTFTFLQRHFQNLLTKYIFKDDTTIQDIRLLAFCGEIQFYTSDANVHFLELNGMHKRTVCRNLTIVGSTDLKYNPYHRYWDNECEEYDPNHYFSIIKK